MLGSALHYSSDFGIFPCCSTTNANYVTLGVRPDLQFSSNVNFSVAYWIRLPAGFNGGDLPFFTDAINSTFKGGFTFAPTYGSSGHFGGNVDGGWALSLYNATGAYGFGVYGDAGSINDGNWHHLVHTFDRTNGMVTYLDGNATHYTSEGPRRLRAPATWIRAIRPSSARTRPAGIARAAPPILTTWA